MQRTSDWFEFDPDRVGLPPGRNAGGFARIDGVSCIHRTMLPLLTGAQRAKIGDPVWFEGVEDVDPTNLRAYQVDAATFAREREGSLLAMSMGTGKTRTSLYAVREDRDQVGVIVAPKVTFPVWQKEIALVFGADYPVRILSGRTPGVTKGVREPGINLLNPEILGARWSEWLGFRLDYGILDEAHYYTRGRAGRTQAAAALANLCRRRVALTGTPILRHVMDLHGIIQAIAPWSFGGWQQLAVWLGLRRGPHGWDLKEPLTLDARERLDARLLEIALYRRWEEVSEFVPPLQRELLRVEFEPDEAKQYQRLADDVREALGDQPSLADLVQASVVQLVQVLALRRFVGRAKIRHVVDLVRSAGEPVVVWTWHRDVAKETAAALRKEGLRVSLVTGEDADKVRQANILRFQVGETDVFVGTIAVASVGIDLTRARITVMGEMSWLPAEIAQAEARVFRTGQTRPCITYWPIFRKTIEDRILEILIAKADHAREDIFPDGTVKLVQYNPEEVMVSLLDGAMEEEDE